MDTLVPEVEDDWSFSMRKVKFIPIAHLALASDKIFGRKRKMNKNNIFMTRRRQKGPLKVKVRLRL